MTFFPVTLFPEGGLAGSIITTVWVGVFVMCFFNLRYGWVLSGLVVPGYLVPLMIVKPLAATIIGIEAVLTYTIVWLFSEKIAPGRFPALFGRDRFMGLILASVAVRLAFDGWLLPVIAFWVDTRFDHRLDWESNLQSFGLVVVSLMANQFWKPGLARGLFMAVVTIGLTFLIVRYGLMELTNFRISGVHHLYEGLSSSILASPKAYMILILTAMLASHYNVRYGWDFSGILIPALIALQWYQPMKILTSFGEAVIIYMLAQAVLRLPVMANVTLEGGRKLLLFFNIAFAWKVALGWFVIWRELEIVTSDYFGFGYLLSTLIAIKAHDKDIFPRVARSTLQVSLAGAVMGNVVGFTLSAASLRAPWSAPAAHDAQMIEGERRLNALVVDALGDAHLRKARNTPQPLQVSDRDVLARLVELLERDRSDIPFHVTGRMEGWHIFALDEGRLAIQRADGRGKELVVFDPHAQRGQAIVLPDPTAARGLAIAALALQASQDARWLIFDTALFDTERGVASVAEIVTDTLALPHVVIRPSSSAGTSTLSFSGEAAAVADLPALRDVVPSLKLALAHHRAGSGASRAILSLDEETLARLALRFAALDTGSDRTCVLKRLPDEQTGWTSLPQLAYTRFEIAAPFVKSASEGAVPHHAAAAAALAGMTLERCRIGNQPHWALSAKSRDEGTIYLAEGRTPERGVLTFENARSDLPATIGRQVHQAWRSDALFVATRSDSFLRDPRTVFDVMFQEWVRRQDRAEQPQVFQLRARPREAIGYANDVKVLIAKDRIGGGETDFAALSMAVEQAGYATETVSGQLHQAGVEARPGMSMRYYGASDKRRYAFGWLLYPGVGDRAAKGSSAP